MNDSDLTGRHVRPGHRHMLGAGMKRQWCVRMEASEEQVEADEVEITASGVLAFYRGASRKESGRTLLVAFSPGAWRRCELESDRS